MYYIGAIIIVGVLASVSDSMHKAPTAAMCVAMAALPASEGSLKSGARGSRSLEASRWTTLSLLPGPRAIVPDDTVFWNPVVVDLDAIEVFAQVRVGGIRLAQETAET
jgi:hypothetical protein